MISDDAPKGRTVYVGSRKGAAMMRIYEKGRSWEFRLARGSVMNSNLNQSMLTFLLQFLQIRSHSSSVLTCIINVFLLVASVPSLKLSPTKLTNLKGMLSGRIGVSMLDYKPAQYFWSRSSSLTVILVVCYHLQNLLKLRSIDLTK